MNLTQAIIILLLTLAVPSPLCAQKMLDCSIQFSDTVMIGEPFYFKYHLTKTRKGPITVYYDSQGENQNELKRDESFDIKVTFANKKIIPNRISKQNEISVISRRVGFQPLNDSESLIYRHYINHWVEFKKPGQYEITASKEFSIQKRKRKFITSTASCKATFEVMAFDSVKAAKDITRQWLQMEVERDYSKRYQMMDRICRSKSESIIPYLEQVIDSSSSISDIQYAMKGLSKFNMDTAVFHILCRAFECEDSRFRKQVTREKLLFSFMENIKGPAILYLSGFDDSLVIPYLRKHYKNKLPRVRLYIMQELHRKKDAQAKMVILENLNDEDTYVRSAAEHLIKSY